MRVPSAFLAAVVMALAPSVEPLGAQSLSLALGGRTASLAQPPSLRWTGAASVGWARGQAGTNASAALGLQRDVLNQMLSLLAVQGELYLRAGSADLQPGVRARLFSPFARVGAGLDYGLSDSGPDLLLSFSHPVRRGGVFADGSVLRLDYLPGRDRSVSVGIEKPLRNPARIGRSRPAHDRVRLPTAPRTGSPASVTTTPSTPAACDSARGAECALGQRLAEVREAARLVRIATLPLGPVPAAPALHEAAIARELEPLLKALRVSDVGSAENVVRRYHRALDHAFGSADIAAGARRILLEDVLLPYDRTLGQRKTNDQLRGFAAVAYGDFERWLHTTTSLHAAQRDSALHVFRELLGIMEENRAAARAQWRDSRFVWLPLQYALRPEDHDTQAELDALIELAVGERFADGNFVSWVVNEQFQYQLSRTIQRATEYHVLLTHDFRGIDARGDPDEMSYRHVLRSYLATMTERVREYDRTGRFPTYMIVMDQWFYEVNRGRLWMTLLENPLTHRLELPASHRAWQDSIAAAQQALRDAVAASSLLQSQARQHGAGWLANLIKVHVNITNPADATFWSNHVVRGLPLPDNMMRDHRKIVFFDITEEDPYRGEAMFTGAGVGEHYANLSWEDRSLLVRGPALLRLKTVVRELLVNQGLSPERLPYALQPRPRADDYDVRIRDASARNPQPLRALQVHNGAGFDDKYVNVVKAVLYTLMPPGSVIKIPDSLWNSDFWGSALLGCALRGGRILIIAPAEGNAPADAMGALGRSHEMLGRLLIARQLLGPDIERASGLLRIGLYRSHAAVNDIAEKVRLVGVAFATQPWLRTLFDFPPAVLDDLSSKFSEIRGLAMAPADPEEFEYDPLPKLHLKANFFASREAWTLINRPEWAAASHAYMQIRISQLQDRPLAVRSFEEFPDAIADVGAGMVKEWHAALDAGTRERVVFYSLIGSHNQNSRSMVIDAEVAFLISQWPAIIPYIDLVIIIGQTQWIDNVAELRTLLPFDAGWKRRLAQWIRLAL